MCITGDNESGKSTILRIPDGSYEEVQADPYFQQLMFDKENGIA